MPNFKMILPSQPHAKTAALALLMLFRIAPSGFASQIFLPSQIAAPGATALDPVAFTSQAGSVSGIQFDLQYDNSAMSLVATLGDPAKASGKNLYAVDLSPNKKRFLIIGINQTSIPDGTLLNLSVSIRPNATSGTYSLSLSNVSGTDPSGSAAALTGSDGIMTVVGSPGALLQPNGVVNAASLLPGPVAPGEFVTLFGSGIGPTSVQRPSDSVSRTVLGGVSVFFDGTPAPLLYAAPNQINAIVPFTVAGKTTTQVTITSQGQTVAAVAQAVASAAPAIFTLDATGTGQGAILNQDLSVNSVSNPAVKGSAIAIYATGAGQTNPAGVDGQVTGTVLATPLLPVSVQIGGVDAKVLYAGAAPGQVAGVIQINALIPSTATSGSAVPVALTIGQAGPAGVTVAIR